MTDKQALLAIALRCEKATGADRELDALIAAACRYFPPNVGFVWKAGLRANVPEIGRVECHTNLGTGGPHYASPKFTASLDAAMTLVPEGYKPMLCQQIDDERWRANLWYGKSEGVGFCYAATPALALTAACLRAIAGAME